MNIHNKKILITGGAGYIGSKLVSLLVKMGHDVCVVDDLSTGLSENISSDIRFYHMDINDPEFQHIVGKEQPNCIVHMAASKSVNESMTNPEKFRQINVNGSKHVIDTAIAHNVDTFIFTSTAGVYGDVQGHVAQKESDTPNPSSVYAQTKLEIEEYILSKNKTGFNGHIVRFANVYGIGGNASQKGAINIFIDAILSEKTIDIHGDGTQTRDFVHIDDLLSICMLLITTTPSLHGETPIYNVSTGVDISINSLIQLISELTGRPVQKRYLPNIFIGQKSSLLSTQKAQQVLGWSSKITLKNGIQEMIKQYKEVL